MDVEGFSERPTLIPNFLIILIGTKVLMLGIQDYHLKKIINTWKVIL